MSSSPDQPVGADPARLAAMLAQRRAEIGYLRARLEIAWRVVDALEMLVHQQQPVVDSEYGSVGCGGSGRCCFSGRNLGRHVL